MRRATRSMLVVAQLVLAAGCGGKVATLVPVPDGASRVEISTASPGWEQRVAESAACLVRTVAGTDCSQPNPSVCDSRTKEQVLAEIQAIVDSLPRVLLTNAFAMNKQLTGLFPTATSSFDVADARRATPCKDWSGGACAAIRTKEVGFLFSGTIGAAPTSIQIFRVTGGCRQEEPTND